MVNLKLLLVIAAVHQASADNCAADGSCAGDKDGSTVLQTRLHVANDEQMTFEHRKGDVKLQFTTKTYNDEECQLEGSLTDNDKEAGSLNIEFAVEYLKYKVTDGKTGQVIYEEDRPEGKGSETITIEGDSFKILSGKRTGKPQGKVPKKAWRMMEEDAEGEEEEEEENVKEDSSSFLKNSILVHIGEGTLLEEKALDAEWLEAQQETSRAQFKADVEKLLADSRSNALLELAVAFSNAGISGATYPCSFPLLSLAQNLREKGKVMSTQTKQDVAEKEAAARAKNSKIRSREFTAAAEKGLLLQSSATSNTSTGGCQGCSPSCGNTCFGLCGMDCSHWTFVCRESPSTAFLGCCAHDGWCSCGGLHWYECWAFHGECSSIGCARNQCTVCTSCSGTVYRDNTRRRRRWWPPRRRRTDQAKGRCTQCARRTGENINTYVSRCFSRRRRR